MRKLIRILPLMLIIASVSSCDMFRALVGRPTSKQIAAKKAAIAQLENSLETQADTSALETQAADKQCDEDSSAVEQAKAKLKSLGHELSSNRNISEPNSLEYRYYIIVGAFSSRENADKLISHINAKGYHAYPIGYKSGLTAVGVSPSNSLQEIIVSLDKLSYEKFCPADAWVLEN